MKKKLLIIGISLLLFIIFIGIVTKIFSKKTKYYKCDSNGKCIEDTSGGTNYPGDPNCGNHCKVPPPPPPGAKYTCDNATGTCTISSTGTMDINECASSCSAKLLYTCDNANGTCSTIKASENDYTKFTMPTLSECNSRCVKTTGAPKIALNKKCGVGNQPFSQFATCIQPSPSPPSGGCCSWDKGKTKGGKDCNVSEAACKECGNGSQWYPPGSSVPCASPPGPPAPSDVYTCIQNSDANYAGCKPPQKSGSGGGGGKPWPGPPPPTPPHPPAVPGKGVDLANFVSGYTGDPVKATTTNFGFGGNTSCGCNGNLLSHELAKSGYVGVATPDWLQSTFNTTTSGVASGVSTPAKLSGTAFVSNCSSGSGGCGQCFELTTTGEPNIDEKKEGKTVSDTPQGKTAKVVVLDTCEDRNAYGNNWQWCIAATGVPKDGINTASYSGTDLPTDKGGDKVRFGVFKTDDKSGTTKWVPPAECIDKNGKWVCTNLAGAPLHFDFGFQTLTDDDKKYLPNIWDGGANPVVTAKPIACDPQVIPTLQTGCGGNVKTTPDLSVCRYYCPTAQGATLPHWWGGCKNDPNCSLNQCGGKEPDGKTPWSGPTCCQWGMTCKKTNDYWSGCV